jgi:hypothetical protein
MVGLIGPIGVGSIEDVVAEIAGRHRKERPPRPQPDAAAETLRERYLELGEEHELRDGDIVIYKAGFDPRPRGEEGNQPLLYLADDPDEYPEDAFRMREGRADCVVVTLHPHDGTGVFLATDSRWLEPWPRKGGDPAAPPEETDED